MKFMIKNLGNGLFVPSCMSGGNGYEDMVKFVLENGDNSNSKTSYGESALHVAVHTCTHKVAMAEMLINYGADIRDTEYSGGKPLRCKAVESRAEDRAQLLLEKGADINEKDSFSGLAAIHHAMGTTWFGQYFSMIKLLIRKNCDVTLPPNLVLRSIDFGEIKAIKLLCEAGFAIIEPFGTIYERVRALD